MSSMTPEAVTWKERWLKEGYGERDDLMGEGARGHPLVIYQCRLAADLPAYLASPPTHPVSPRLT